MLARMPPGPTCAERRPGSHRLSIKTYLIKLVEAHWVEMEQKGILPESTN